MVGDFFQFYVEIPDLDYESIVHQCNLQSQAVNCLMI